MLLVFGLSNLAFSLADMVVGHLDPLPTYIRAGTLDAFYLRPLPVLAQLMTSDFTLQRLAPHRRWRLVALGSGCCATTSHWWPATVLLLVIGRGLRDCDLRGAVRLRRAACSSSSSTAPS